MILYHNIITTDLLRLRAALKYHSHEMYFHLTQFPLLTICRLSTIYYLLLSTICYYLQFQFNVEARTTAAASLSLGVGGDPEAGSDEFHMVVDS